jgi:hypothetical protein
MVLAYVVLVLAILSRVLPHLLHLTGANVTMVGAGLLFFGSRLRPANRWRAMLAVAALAATDWWLTVYGYSYPFHLTSYLPTWLWYAAVCLIASAALYRQHGAVRVGVAALASSTSFFLLSNGMVWLRGGMYPHTSAGLADCYLAGLPFYRNDLASTLVFSAAFFALPWAASSLTAAARSMGNHGSTAA